VDHCLNGVRAVGTTGKCLVLVTADAERSMNTYLGISETLSVAELDPDAIAASEYVYIEGYLVTSSTGLAAAVRTREIAEAAGVKTALSFSDPGMVEFFREGMASIVGTGVDLVFCNEAEALQWGETDSLQVAIEKLKRVARSFVITLGADGAITYDGNEQVSIPPHRVQAVDSNGAGDMFAGAFLYAITRGEEFPVAGRFASLAAGRIVANYGPRLPAADYPALRAEFFGD
jgi:sugar/nucleoside kinase (ribokinase family)